jgi:hypothetical protein
LHADVDFVSEQRQDEDDLLRLRHGAGDGVVAASAARILANADHAVQEIRTEAERAVAEVRGRPVDPARATENLRAEVEAELRVDRAALADLTSHLASIHSQLDMINASLIGLQSQRLRQIGIGALALAVPIAIAWKVIAG